MDSYSSVCSLWADDHVMAEDTGASLFAVQKWRLRDKIPPGWWHAVVTAAKRRGFKGVTLENLAVIAAHQRETA